MTYTILKDENNNTLCIKLTDDNNIEKFIPLTEANRHYQEYLKWVANGNAASEETVN
jgi:hypothetical protein